MRVVFDKGKGEDNRLAALLFAEFKNESSRKPKRHFGKPKAEFLPATAFVQKRHLQIVRNLI